MNSDELQFELFVPERRPWTVEEGEYLRAQYGVLSMTKLEQKLQRTPAQIEGKAARLGLKRHPRTRRVSA